MRLAIIILPLAFLLWMAWSHRWMSDDGFINLRVVQQLRAGHGPVFNAGERVEAGTSVLWIAILALASFLSPLKLEWTSVLLGVLFTLGGCALAMDGAMHVGRRARNNEVVVPVGVILLAVLPPMWDFATSGLELGLSVLWVGACFAVLARRSSAATRMPAFRPWWAPVLLGLGPLVRPDFALFSVCFLVALLMVSEGPNWAPALRAVGLALAAPLAYELFRMGYYASLVPNTALAKEASRSWWHQGWLYLWDFVSPYWLWVPLLAVLGGALVPLLRNCRRDRARFAVVSATLLGGLAETIYVVRVGGDYQHGRLLLPALFAVLAPVAVVPIAKARIWLVGVIVPWALVCAVSLRPAYAAHRAYGAVQITGPHGIGDSRAALKKAARNPHPITLRDYRVFTWARGGYSLRDASAAGRQFVVLVYTGVDNKGQWLTPPPSNRSRVTAGALSIGMISYAAGPNVHIVDLLGLGDPLAARVELPQRGLKPGHEKLLPFTWVVARFADQSAPIPPGVQKLLESPPLGFPSAPAPRQEIQVAREVLQCDPVRDLLQATSGGLTVGRFASNVLASPRLDRLRVPADPVDARSALCQ